MGLAEASLDKPIEVFDTASQQTTELALYPAGRSIPEHAASYRGHDDDKRRKQRRKALMLLDRCKEKEFTPKDLTQTSQLVRLAPQTVTRAFVGGKDRPRVISLPGSVTGIVRKSWDVTGCLAGANGCVLDENGEVQSKTEIRDITHLRHHGDRI